MHVTGGQKESSLSATRIPSHISKKKKKNHVTDTGSMLAGKPEVVFACVFSIFRVAFPVHKENALAKPKHWRL